MSKEKELDLEKNRGGGRERREGGRQGKEGGEEGMEGRWVVKEEKGREGEGIQNICMSSVLTSLCVKQGRVICVCLTISMLVSLPVCPEKPLKLVI